MTQKYDNNDSQNLFARTENTVMVFIYAHNFLVEHENNLCLDKIEDFFPQNNFLLIRIESTLKAYLSHNSRLSKIL